MGAELERLMGHRIRAAMVRAVTAPQSLSHARLHPLASPCARPGPPPFAVVTRPVPSLLLSHARAPPPLPLPPTHTRTLPPQLFLRLVAQTRHPDTL
eukprot:351251-Chlamydomonas_euryale.AAC.1